MMRADAGPVCNGFDVDQPGFRASVFLGLIFWVARSKRGPNAVRRAGKNRPADRATCGRPDPCLGAFFEIKGGLTMRKACALAFVLTVCYGVGMGDRADAAELADVTTLWNFLGIPQGVHRIRDAVVNTRGNHPNWERKPRLKRIADPANLESGNPAIEAAAKIKADQDLAPQKIKAIKFLAKVGCGCAKNKGIRSPGASIGSL